MRDLGAPIIQAPKLTPTIYNPSLQATIHPVAKHRLARGSGPGAGSPMIDVPCFLTTIKPANDSPAFFVILARRASE